MSLTSTEIDRAKHECGYPSTRIGAEPYITYSAVWDVAIQPFLTDVGSTSATLVAAAQGGARVAIVVAANPSLPQKPNGDAFVVGSRVNVDVGPNQEPDVVVEAVVGGTTIYLTLTNSHGVGTIAYPIVLAGAEAVVREILGRLDVVRGQLRDIAPRAAGVASADKGEASFFASRGRGREQRSMWDELIAMRNELRDELCRAINVPNLWRISSSTWGSGGGGRMLEPA